VTTLLNGSIQVESELGKGTRFILDLPLNAPESLQQEEEVEESAEPIDPGI
jgi:hypothetical protein